MPTVTIEPASTSNTPIKEGESNVAAFKVKRTLGNGALSVALRVNSVAPGAGIATAGDDFTTNPAITGGNNDDITVSFANGELEKIIYLSAKLDQLVEGDETVMASLYDGYETEGYEIGSPSNATVTIKDGVTLNSLTVEDLSRAANTATATGANSSAMIYIAQKQLGSGPKIKIRADFIPNTAEDGEHVLFALSGNSVSGVGGSDYAGNFAGNDPIRTLTPASDGDRTFMVYAGVDADDDGGLDPEEVTHTVTVNIYYIDITKSYSDQFATFDGNNSSDPGTVKTFILMGTRQDDKAYSKFDIDFRGDEEAKRDLVYAYENTAHTSEPVDLITGAWSAGRLKLNGDLPFGMWNNEPAYSIVPLVGFDDNGDGKLGQDEVLVRGETPFKVINRAAYNNAIADLRWIATGGEWVGRKQSADWLNAFVDNTDFPGATSSDDSIDGLTDTRLDHRVGVDYATNPNIRKHVFGPETDVAQWAAGLTTSGIYGAIDEASRIAILNAAKQIRVDIPQGQYDAIGESENWFGPFDVQLSGDYFSGGDAGTALGHVAYKNVKIWVKAFHYVGFNSLDNNYSHAYGAGSFRIQGTMVDIYDFRYKGTEEFADYAAIVQAGYGTLGTAGHVRLTEINMDNVVESTTGPSYEEYTGELYPVV